MEYNKAKSAQKIVKVRGPELTRTVLHTLETISGIVGATLGPGGRSVLIERYEDNLPPMVTKDGVTSFRALGFQDPTAHTIMEAARDCAVRTASEAGDGTTTATVLAEAIVRNIDKFCHDNPKISPQRIVRRLGEAFVNVVEPAMKEWAIPADLTTQKGSDLLHAVAKVSGNGDVALADAVMKCYEICGDEGNVTIVEQSGNSGYGVEPVSGYGLPIGYEESCGPMWSKFVNDAGTQRCLMQNPVFIVYNGKITEIQTVQLLLERIGFAWGQMKYNKCNIVLVATEFSTSVLGQLAVNFPINQSINVYPLRLPLSPIAGGQLGILEDICAITGAVLFDPMNHPLDSGEFQDLGPGVELFEVSRYRCNIVGHAAGPKMVAWEDDHPIFDPSVASYDDLLLCRIDDVLTQANQDVSQLDKLILQERAAKLSGGIARLKVIGSSHGETKERRDRAEDAVCGVRGAIASGILLGGGHSLLKLSLLVHEKCVEDGGAVDVVLGHALLEPVYVLLENAGLTFEERGAIVKKLRGAIGSGEGLIYDAASHEYVDAVEAGILDSYPAVCEAIRNSISIAALLGTLGGTIVFPRDIQLEQTEARDTANFLRDASAPSEADLRP